MTKLSMLSYFVLSIFSLVRAPPSITVQEAEEPSEMTVVDMKAHIDRVVNQGKYVSIHIMWSPFSSEFFKSLRLILYSQ